MNACFQSILELAATAAAGLRPWPQWLVGPRIRRAEPSRAYECHDQPEQMGSDTYSCLSPAAARLQHSFDKLSETFQGTVRSDLDALQ